MNQMKRNAFTLVEVLIVVIIMAVLAATVIPQFSDSTGDAKLNTSVFNVQTIRGQIETYKAQHGGSPPSTLDKLTKKTDKTGAENAAGPYGPYLQTIPEETLSGKNTVVVVTSNPITASDVTSAGGWLYNATTGEIRINDATHVTK